MKKSEIIELVIAVLIAILFYANIIYGLSNFMLKSSTI